ncbi:MAG: hypothetical protein ACREIB_01785, partial [Pseudomonadota bacterium]
MVKIYNPEGAAVLAVDHCTPEIEAGEICMIVGVKLRQPASPAATEAFAAAPARDRRTAEPLEAAARVRARDLEMTHEREVEQPAGA